MLSPWANLPYSNWSLPKEAFSSALLVGLDAFEHGRLAHEEKCKRGTALGVWMKKEVRHWSWFWNILLHMAGLRLKHSLSSSFTFTLVLLLCRNVSKKTLVSLLLAQSSSHENASIPCFETLQSGHAYFYSRHCLFGSTLALLACLLVGTCPLAGAVLQGVAFVSIAWRNTFFKSASKLFVGVSFLHP